MSRLLAFSIAAVVVAAAAPYGWEAWRAHRAESHYRAWLEQKDREIACLEALGAEGEVPGRDIDAEIARCGDPD